MSGLTLFGILTTVLQSGVLLFVIVKSIRLMIKEKTGLLPFFFALSMSSYLLSNLYWIAYDVLRPETRMPIACNEIGECAMILLLSAGLEMRLTDRKRILGEIVFAFLFIGANIALWIAWSGEWFQDIVFGIPYIYFMWVLIRGLRSRCSLKRTELWMASVMSIFVLAMQIPLLVYRNFLFVIANIAYPVVMFSLMAWLGIKSFRDRDFFVSSTFFLWTELSMFLSPDIYYNIAMILNTVAVFVLFVSMKKELLDDDIR